MEELAERLLALLKAKRVLNADLVIGSVIQDLFRMLHSISPVPPNVEDVLLELICADLNINNATFVGLCCVSFYRQQKHVNYWKLMPLLTDRIRGYHIPAIVVLGIMSRKLCEGFKSQLHAPISILLNASEELMPLACQCFRRVIKGTGTFLGGLIPDIFAFMFCGASSTNEALRIESVKSLPAMLQNARISIQKLLPIVEQLLPATSKQLYFAVAKSCAKLVFLGAKASAEHSENPFGYSLPILLQFAQNERNIPTIATSLVILSRLYAPTDVLKSLRTFAKFIFSATQMDISIGALLIIVNSVFQAVTSVAGSTAGSSLSRHLFETISSGNMSASQAIMTMFFLSEYECPQKTLALGAKYIYPSLASNRKDVQRACVSFFARIASRDSVLSSIFIETFLSYLAKSDTKSNEIEWFSKATACLLIETETIKPKAIECVRNLVLSWLSEKADIRSPSVVSAFLLAAAAAKRKSCVEVIPRCFNFIQTIIKRFSDLEISVLKKLTKAISLYTIAVLQTIRTRVDRLIPTIKSFVNCVLPKTPHLSNTGLSLLWKLMKNVPVDSKIADEMVNNTIILIDIMAQRDLEISGQLVHEVDMANILYGVSHKLPKNTTMTHLLVGDVSDAMKVIIDDFTFWISNCSASVCASVIPSLWEFDKKTMNQVRARLLMLAAVLKSKREINFPPVFLNVVFRCKAVFENQQLRGPVAQVIGRWLARCPNQVETVFRRLSTANPALVSWVVSDCAAEIKATVAVRVLLILHNFVTKSSCLAEELHAIALLLRENSNNDDIVLCASNLLEQLAFNDSLRNPTTMVSFGESLPSLQKMNRERLRKIYLIFSHYGTNRTLSLLYSLKVFGFLAKDAKPLFNTGIATPLPILVIGYRYIHSLKAAPSLFTILQQSGDTTVEDSIYSAVKQTPDVKFWIDMCKRIVIMGCVPPADRTGDVRVVPTHTVLICALKIAVMLVSKMRENFATQLSCVDDVVAIAFNAIHMNDRRIDFHCFSILTSVIECFADVRNKDGALLDVYISQFHPTLVRAVDGSHDLSSIAGFVIAFYRYILENDTSLVPETEVYLIRGLKKLKFDEQSLTFFCRIASLLGTDDSELNQMLSLATTTFVQDVCMQKRHLAELKSELPDVISRVPDDFPIPRRVILALLVMEFELHCNSTTLAAITALAKHPILDNESIDVVLGIIDKSRLLEEETETQQEKNVNDDSDLDASAFFVVSKPRKRAVTTFLSTIAPKCTDQTWRSAVSFALRPPISYSTLAQLVTTASESLLNDLGPSILASVLADPISDNANAFLVILLNRLPVNVIDGIIEWIVHLQGIETDTKFKILRILAPKVNGFVLHSLSNLARFIHQNLLPEGIGFLGSLMIQNSTQLFGLSLLAQETMEAIATAIVSKIGLRYLPKIMHFLYLALECVQNHFSESERERFELGLTRVVFLSLIRIHNFGDRAPVVAPAAMILKKVNPSVVECAFEVDRNRCLLVTAVSPPKQMKGIQLKAFSSGNLRKIAATGRWQSLEFVDDFASV